MGISDRRIRRQDRALVLRAAMVGAVVLAVVVAGLLVPHPAAATVRAWADSTGSWFVVLFVLAHVVVTVFPVPRTFFTVAAGFLFGPIGIVLCVAASTVAAAIAFGAVREFDRRVPRRC